MKETILAVACATTFIPFLAFQLTSEAQPGDGVEFTADNQLLWPEKYSRWVYVGSGLGMAYVRPQNNEQASDPPFTNVFVNPSAYDEFVQTGRWPNKTTMVVEVRKSLSKGSINQTGHYEGPLQVLEVHVKDEARFPGKWGFYGFNPGAKSASLIPASANCYSCHADHGRVDTTFVQFYPTLFNIASQKGTLAPEQAPATPRASRSLPVEAPAKEKKPEEKKY